MIWEKACDRMFSGKVGYITAYKLQSQLYISTEERLKKMQ